MNKEQLIEVLRTSLPSHRMLQMVNIGAVKIGNEIIILKQRPNCDLVESEIIFYNERHDMYHNYHEILAKTVVFHLDLLNRRGRDAIMKYIMEQERNYCQECGKKLDIENNEYQARYGTCGMYCHGKLVGAW